VPDTRISQLPIHDNRWTKAAVVGGLWASFEIVIGSFLHNLHLPFSGSILAFFATILMIAFYQVWPEKGLIWRAGLICALMKSISPSGIILGPMTGIFTEALLVDFFLRLLGNNLAGLAVAGIFSQLSALLHKVIKLLILYGFDIVRIYENVFEFALRQFKNFDLTPERAVLYIILVYAALGLMAAFIGYRIGKKATGSNSGKVIRHNKLVPDTSWDFLAPGQRFYVFLLILHLVLLPALLFLLNSMGLHPVSLSLCIAYILFCLFWYERIKFRLFKPFFMIHLLIIGALAGFFWESPDSIGNSSHWEGWKMGFSLILRAILVISSFSALSTELRNPRLKTFLFKFGFKKIYFAVTMAFSILPLMIERGASGKSFLANPFKTLNRTLHEANEWLYVLQQKNNK